MLKATEPFVYLASQSPRRAHLLDQLGVAHRPLVPSPDEDAESLEAVHGNESPATYVKRVTALKLEAALARMLSRKLPPAPVLCADTSVAIGRMILGKPIDSKDAARMLALLSGRTHRVLSAVALHSQGTSAAVLSVSSVRFAALSAARIDEYIATGEPLGKAGAYAVQGRAAAFISRLGGSYSGIMGLPIFECAQLLRAAGFAV